MSFAKYQSYRASDIDWIGDLPAHWQIRNLRSGGDIWGGAGFPHEHQGEENLELPFYKVGDLSRASDGRVLSAASHTVSRATAAALRARIVPVGGVVYAKIGAALLLNRRRQVPQPCCIDNNMTAFIPNERLLSSDWAFWWTSSLNFGEFVNPGAVPSLSEGDQGRLPLLLPPINEQSAIASFLDRKTAGIDTLIARQQRLIELLQEKRQALITRAVTKGLDPAVPMKDSGVEWLGEVPAHWKVAKLKHDLDFVTSGSRGWAEHYSEAGSLFIRIGNLTRDSIDLDLSDVQYVNVPAGAEGERTRVQPGDLLVSITAFLGSVAVVPDGIDRAYVSQHIAMARPSKEGAGASWMAYCMLSDYGRRYFDMTAYGGTKVQLSLDDVRSFPIVVPPARERLKLIELVELEVRKIGAAEAKARRIIELFKEHRAALISAAVTGKIDVREPVSAVSDLIGESEVV